MKKTIHVIAAMFALLLGAGFGDHSFAAEKGSPKDAGASLSRAGIYVYVPNGEGDTVSVFEHRTGKLVTEVTVGKRPHGVVASPDGTEAYTINFGDNSVSVIETATFKVIHTIPVGKAPHHGTICPHGIHLVVPNSGDNTVSVIDTAARKVIATVPAGKAPLDVVITPDDRFAYLVLSGENAVAKLKTHDFSLLTVIPVGTKPHHAAVSPDGRWVFVANEGSNDVSVIDVTTNAVVATISVPTPHDIAFALSGRHTWDAYISSPTEKTLTVIETPSFRQVTKIAVEKAPTCVTSAVSTFVYAANTPDNAVTVVDAVRNTVVGSFATGKGPQKATIGH